MIVEDFGEFDHFERITPNPLENFFYDEEFDYELA
jgi:hypothetical protein